MALQVPTAADFSIPTTWEERGPIYVDGSANETGSSITKPSVYVSKNVCGADEFKKFNISTSITVLKNCKRVSAGGLTIKGSIPADATITEVQEMIDLLVDDYLTDALA